MKIQRFDLIILIFAFTVALIENPYTGIRHDSVLYLGQALFYLKPNTYSQDIFFQFGSQASFTIFPQLVGFFINKIETGTLFLAATFCGKVLFIAASACLLKEIYKNRENSCSLLCLVILPSYYGSYWIFSYNESFFTGRTLAEPLALWSIYYLLKEKKKTAAIAFFLSAAIHPLQAIPVLFVGWFYIIKKKPIKYAIPIASSIGLLILFKIDDVSQIFHFYDESWESWISEPNKHVFLNEWKFSAWNYLALDFIILGLSYKLLTEHERKIANSFAQACALGIALTFLNADLLKNVTFTGAQLWRSQWLLHWLTITLCPILISHLAKTDKSKMLILLFVISATYSPNETLSIPIATTIALITYLNLEKIRNRIRPFFEKALIVTLLLGILIMTIASLNQILRIQGESTRELRIDSIVLKTPLSIIFALAIICSSNLKHYLEKKIIVTITISILALTYATIRFDSRSHWTKTIEANAFKEPFQNIPEGAQIYWPTGLLATWLVLNRPSYLTDQQQAGLLFNRKTAEEAYKRKQELSAINIQREICQSIASIDESFSCLPTSETILDICATSNHNISNIILETHIAGIPSEKWSAGLDANGKPIDLYSYPCMKGS